jgi:hypothetical protein
MRSIVERAVAAQADMQLASDGSEGDLEEAIARSGADVLIVAEDADRHEAFYRPLLLAHPSLKVCLLTQDGRHMTLLGFRRVPYVDASPTVLIEAIRRELRCEAKPDDA